MGDIERELAEMRKAVRTRLAARAEGETELEALVDRTRHAGPAGLELPDGDPLPDAVVFREASARTIFSAIGQFADVTVVFDPQFVDTAVTADLRGVTLRAALDTIAQQHAQLLSGDGARHGHHRCPIRPRSGANTRKRWSGPSTLSNADVTETIDPAPPRAGPAGGLHR